MFEMLKRLFRREEVVEEVDEAAAQEWDEEKSRMMEDILGKEHDLVMHALIPYAIGGGLDLYYYPNAIEGVAIATKELSELPGQGSSNDVFDSYELAMFTRHPLSIDDAEKDVDTPFGKAHAKISSILNCMAPYSEQATLNPNETSEFPEDMEKIGGKCMIFDRYGSEEGKVPFGILAIIEVFRSEMDYAREHGGENLIAKLKEAGFYPYSDLEREPVV